MSVSCGDGNIGYATVTVYNNSDYDVTDLMVIYELTTTGFPILGELKKGAKQLFDMEFMPSNGSGQVYAKYTLNERRFGRENEEGVLTDETGTYISHQRFKDGAKAHIYIKNDGYELKIEGGVYYVDPGKNPPR
jgi:hypothetical protein